MLSARVDLLTDLLLPPVMPGPPPGTGLAVACLWRVSSVTSVSWARPCLGACRLGLRSRVASSAAAVRVSQVWVSFEAVALQVSLAGRGSGKGKGHGRGPRDLAEKIEK